ncbi:class I SAM-dependent methyltransferase [Sphingomonas sp. PB4P5]|uniref:class I SAM-dependent methyltransferase n=1 Tax=Parasphingomonas puruogangriensis TaxID=3096155 RepID=UPI002FC81872
MAADHSEGYEAIAAQFIAARSDIDATFVRCWARENLQPSSSIVDVGCGSGVPIARALIEYGFTLFGVDASPSLLAAFRRRFPAAQSVCEAAEDSLFFNRTFDAALAIGLLFLLSADNQRKVVKRVAAALRPGGLFCSPRLGSGANGTTC